MGAPYETPRMSKHVEQCEQCKTAHAAGLVCDFRGVHYVGCCAWYEQALENVLDFECAEGPFEGKQDALMCAECDGPVMLGEACPACGRTCNIN
jgi:hypothetical protein